MPPKVDLMKCKGCETCKSVCPMNVFDIKSDANGKKAVVARPESCIECHACEASCPNGAIHFD